MNTIAIILLVIMFLGIERIGRRHSRETIASVLGFKPAETTLKGWFYIVLWTILILFLIGLVGLIAGA